MSNPIRSYSKRALTDDPTAIPFCQVECLGESLPCSSDVVSPSKWATTRVLQGCTRVSVMEGI
jgi:hypothetical protein